MNSFIFRIVTRREADNKHDLLPFHILFQCRAWDPNPEFDPEAGIQIRNSTLTLFPSRDVARARRHQAQDQHQYPDRRWHQWALVLLYLFFRAKHASIAEITVLVRRDTKFSKVFQAAEVCIYAYYKWIVSF